MTEKDYIPDTSSKSRLGSYLLKYGVPLVISVGLCYLLFNSEDMNPVNVWEIIRRECDFRWIVLNLSLGIGAQVLRAMRWRIQLKALGVTPSLWQLILSIFGTYSVNLVFPRLGEVWRTGYIAAKEQAPFTKVFGSMVADRMADMLTVLILLVLTFIPAGAQLQAYISQSGTSFAGLSSLLVSPVFWCAAVLLFVAVWLAFRFSENTIIARIRKICKGLWNGFSIVVTMPGKGRWLLYTVMLWGCYFFALYCAFRSFPITSRVLELHGMTALAVCFVLTSLAMGVPSNGGIGPWQWAMIFGLALYSADVPGLTREYALSFANLVIGVQTLMLIVQGLFTFGCIALEKRVRHRDKI